jgi:hypothetical protein
MKKLNYRDNNCLDDAFKAIRSNESFAIVFTGWQSKVLNKSIPLYMKYFYELTPSFWGIINKAVINNMEFDYEQKENLLEVNIISSK